MLSVSGLSIQFGSKKLFDDVSFIVNKRDRIGLVGSNGSGKTTLLKIINRNIEPDTGDVAITKHFTIDYLPQDGITYKGRTLYDEVYSGSGDLSDVKNEIDEITKELENYEDKRSVEYNELVERLGELQLKFEDLEGFKIRSKIEKILMGLGFDVSEFNNKTETFSGGWQMRIALSKILLKNPSLILLDEPTNHLDMDSLLWLENYLKSYEGSIILVSHDRKFLDNITNKTIEIYTGKVTIYKGNYSYYVKEKAERNELLLKQFENQQKYLKQQERFIERFRYKATKASAVQSRIKQLEKMQVIELEDSESNVHFKFPPAPRSGKLVMDLQNIEKSYGSKNVLKGLDLQIMRNDKIGFVGANGTGKSTLAKIIIGTETFQKGTKKLGHNAELDYYSQDQADTLDGSKNVLETLDEIASGDVRKQLRNILGSFLFRDDDVFKPVSVLSGGEKSRLALARMLLKPSNFLILDEPTNHLDISSKKVLMEALKKYEGALLIISHDRDFLDGVVNKVIEIKNKQMVIYPGTLSQYLEKKQDELINKNTGGLTDNIQKQSAKERKRQEAELRNKLYKEQKPLREKLEQVESDITKYETLIKEHETEMQREELYKHPEKIKQITIEIAYARKKLDTLLENWVNINNKLNEIVAQNQ